MRQSKRVIVVGASGFGRECLDVLEAMRANGTDLEIVGVVDDSPSEANLERLQNRAIPVLGSIQSWIDDSPTDAQFVLGIGNPTVRRHLVSRLEEAGFSAFTAIHPTASIGSATTLEEGVVVCAGAVISTNVRLGRHVHVNPNVTIGHDADLRDFVSVNPAAVLSGEVVVHSEVLVGACATVLQLLAVGERSIVGAGALVTKNVPPDVVVKGVPGSW